MVSAYSSGHCFCASSDATDEIDINLGRYQSHEPAVLPATVIMILMWPTDPSNGHRWGECGRSWTSSKKASRMYGDVIIDKVDDCSRRSIWKTEVLNRKALAVSEYLLHLGPLGSDLKNGTEQNARGFESDADGWGVKEDNFRSGFQSDSEDRVRHSDMQSRGRSWQKCPSLINTIFFSL